MITFKVQKDIKAAETYYDEHLSSNEYTVAEDSVVLEGEISPERPPLDLTISPSLQSGKNQKLSTADYHSQGGTSLGRWSGKVAERLGLKEGSAIQKEHFMNLLRNLHPETGTQITARMKKDGERRLFFDATVSAPKSVSIMALTMGDSRLEVAHERAVSAAITELQQYAQTRVRTLGRNEVRRTCEIINAQFTHTTSRSHDPQLHTHNVIFNVTFDPEEKRFKALECFSMYERSNLITEFYRNELAREVRVLGYEIERARHGWEIKGVSPEIQELFSKRSTDIKRATANREVELGRKLTNGEIAHISHKTRSAKDTSMTKEQVLERQLSELTDQVKRELNLVLEKARVRELELKIEKEIPSNNFRKFQTSEAEALDSSIEHIYERRSVVKDHEILSQALKTNYGELSLTDLKFELANHKELIIIPEAEKVAHRKHLLLEHDLCDYVAETKNKVKPITPIAKLATDLRQDQKEVYHGVLKSEDKITAIRGGAGTGKSYLIAKLIQNYHGNSMPVLSIAPTSGATQNLKKDLKVDAITMQSFLLNPDEHTKKIKNGVLIVDEAGLISLKEMSEIFESSRDKNFRILLVGDTRQHQAVRAGDALRVLERYGDMKSFNLIEITRQTDNLYNAAVKDISQRNIERAWSTFEQMGVVHEKSDLADIRKAIAEEYLEKTAIGKSTLIVSPTWEEIKNITHELRDHLKAAGRISDIEKIEKTTYSSVSFTESEKCAGKNYIPQVHFITWQKDIEDFKRHSHWQVISTQGNELVVKSGDLTKSINIKQYDRKAFDVTEKKLTEVAVGDRLLVQSNYRDSKNRERSLTNGELLTVDKILDDGSFKTREGKVISKDFNSFDHGYAMTSYGSQGKTCDHVTVAMNIANGKAISMNQFYVSTSRGRESISIYVDDKEYIREKVINSSSRESVMEFLKLEMPRNREREISPQWIDKAREFYRELKERVIDLFDRERTRSFEPER